MPFKGVSKLVTELTFSLDSSMLKPNRESRKEYLLLDDIEQR